MNKWRTVRTPGELAAVLADGDYAEIVGDGIYEVVGSTVTAYGSATVRAYGSATAVADVHDVVAQATGRLALADEEVRGGIVTVGVVAHRAVADDEDQPCPAAGADDEVSVRDGVSGGLDGGARRTLRSRTLAGVLDRSGRPVARGAASIVSGAHAAPRRTLALASASWSGRVLDQKTRNAGAHRCPATPSGRRGPAARQAWQAWQATDRPQLP